MPEFGIALFSLHRTIADGFPLDGIPGNCRDRFDIRVLDPTYPVMDLADNRKRAAFKEALEKTGCRINTVAVGHCGDLSAQDEEERQRAIREHLKWVDRCVELGALAFRANTGGQGKENDSDTLNRCIDSFWALTEHASKRGIRVLIENHGGISGNSDHIVRIIESVGSEWIASLPDFGNFPEESRYADLERIMPYAFAVHAKTRQFDGDRHVSYNLARCVEVVNKSGFQGVWSIEFEGPVGGSGEPADEWDGILRTKNILQSLLI